MSTSNDPKYPVAARYTSGGQKISAIVSLDFTSMVYFEIFFMIQSLLLVSICATEAHAVLSRNILEARKKWQFSKADYDPRALP